MWPLPLHCRNLGEKDGNSNWGHALRQDRYREMSSAEARIGFRHLDDDKVDLLGQHTRRRHQQGRIAMCPTNPWRYQSTCLPEERTRAYAWIRSPHGKTRRARHARCNGSTATISLSTQRQTEFCLACGTFSIAGRRRIERDLPRNFRADRNVSADLGLKGKSCLLSEWKPGAIGLAIVDELSAFGIPAGDIKTVLVEIDPVN